MTREVNKLAGIVDVRFALRSKEVTVAFDPAAVSAEAIIAAIERANEEMVKENEGTGKPLDILGPGPAGRPPGGGS